VAVTEEQARGIIQKEFPQGEAASPIEYRGLYIFMVNLKKSAVYSWPKGVQDREEARYDY
jgi:hypothetical protein